MHPLINHMVKILRKQGKKWNQFFDDDCQNPHLSRATLIQNYKSHSKNLALAMIEDLEKLTGDAPVLSRMEASEPHDYEDYYIYEQMIGEKNLISGVPVFAIALTWMERGIPAAYVLLDPINDDLFTACERSQAQYNNTRLRIRERSFIDVVFTNHCTAIVEKAGLTARIAGAPELEMAWLCLNRGHVGCYTHLEISPGLRLLIKEAGATFFELSHENQSFSLVGHKKCLIPFVEKAQLTPQ